MPFMKPVKVRKEMNTKATDSRVSSWVRAKTQTYESTLQGWQRCLLLWIGKLIQERIQKLSHRISLKEIEQQS